MEKGLGAKAKFVTNVLDGTCDEHRVDQENVLPGSTRTFRTKEETQEERSFEAVFELPPERRPPPKPKRRDGPAMNRQDEKFLILRKVRQKIWDRGEPSPTKREFAALVAAPLGLTFESTLAYLSTLSPANVVALCFERLPSSRTKRRAVSTPNLAREKHGGK